MKICYELDLRIEESKKYREKLMESIFKYNFKAQVNTYAFYYNNLIEKHSTNTNIGVNIKIKYSNHSPISLICSKKG